MKDVQNEKDTRMVPLKKVGIKDLSWPLKILLKGDGYQPTVAQISCSVDLHREKRGIHMSRFIEVLNGLEEITPHIFERFWTISSSPWKQREHILRSAFPISCGRSLPSHGKFPL